MASESPLTDAESALDSEMAGEWVELDEPAYDWTPNGWIEPSCGGDTYHVFTPDTLAQQASLTDRQDTAVLITNPAFQRFTTDVA